MLLAHPATDKESLSDSFHTSEMVPKLSHKAQWMDPQVVEMTKDPPTVTLSESKPTRLTLNITTNHIMEAKQGAYGPIVSLI